ncbi:MAG: hypothetical protein LUI87_16810, partial [Lachnospiraceae bacterium]|nr:hypothetical protein [Lachnospiraceae bacterium]
DRNRYLCEQTSRETGQKIWRISVVDDWAGNQGEQTSQETRQKIRRTCTAGDRAENQANKHRG